MKKTLLLLLALTFGGKFLIAQDATGENDIKNFRFGLKTTGMLTWYKPEDQKKYSSGGVSAKGSYGLITEFRLSKVASIETGFQVDYVGGKMNMLDTNYYELSKDSGFLGKNDSTSGSTRYKLNSRIYKTTYGTIPFALKLKTPEIGALTYFGMFGINASVRLKSKVTDDVNAAPNGVLGGHSTQENIINSKDMNLLMFALNLGAGAEWNLAGSTSLVFGLNWYNGFSNVLKPNSEFLFRTKSNNYNATSQNAKSSAIALTVGVLF